VRVHAYAETGRLSFARHDDAVVNRNFDRFEVGVPEGEFDVFGHLGAQRKGVVADKKAAGANQRQSRAQIIGVLAFFRVQENEVEGRSGRLGGDQDAGISFPQSDGLVQAGFGEVLAGEICPARIELDGDDLALAGGEFFQRAGELQRRIAVAGPDFEDAARVHTFDKQSKKLRVVAPDVPILVGRVFQVTQQGVESVGGEHTRRTFYWSSDVE
jgi:hypothetical protein